MIVFNLIIYHDPFALNHLELCLNFLLLLISTTQEKHAFTTQEKQAFTSNYSSKLIYFGSFKIMSKLFTSCHFYHIKKTGLHHK